MRPEKFDIIKNEPFAGRVSDNWTKQSAYSVVFADGTKGTIRTSKSLAELEASGKYKQVVPVRPTPAEMV